MKPLFIFEMANNHMGDPAHGIRIIQLFEEICREYRSDFEFGFKLQYRDLDTFIHSSFRSRDDLKYIKRFKETRLSDIQFRSLVRAIKDSGFRAICTPFDENSVQTIESHEIEVIKIASCSLTDWPLLERIARTDKPIIASTASASMDDIDRVVNFFQHRKKDLTIMHCVAEYPAADGLLQIGQISLLKNRYSDFKIGYSTHESPNNMEAVMLAVACGAQVFEKHVGLKTDSYALNDYSASPEQVRAWLSAAKRAFAMMGETGSRYKPSNGERDSLLALRRGAFARREINEGVTISADDVEFAFPASDGQVTANDWSKYSRFTATRRIEPGEPIEYTATALLALRSEVGSIVESVKALLGASNVIVPAKAELEISHHYGIENFERFGVAMINVVNREYCKKLLVVLSGQSHPEQYHLKKEETFVLLYGDIQLVLDGEERVLEVGDVVTVNRGVRHQFSSKNGCVLEEISSTHIKDDSYYTDPEISKNLNRKTVLTYWM